MLVVSIDMHSANHPAAGRTVYLIENDNSVRIALERLIISAGMPVRAFAGASQFLAEGLPRDGACIIADVMMEGMSGLELQRHLKEAGCRVHLIIVTAYDTEEARDQAMKAGAVAYFRKPVDDQALLDAIAWAISRGVAKA